MEYAEAMTALEKLGNPQTKKTWLAHGATGALFGVKIGDMKGLVKQLKGRQDVALKLYASGNLDAMYMAGLIADGAKMGKQEIETWAKSARWKMISEYTVPWVACESPHARELALAWTRSTDEGLASIGWNTYAGIVCTRPDSDLDLKEIEGLLARIEKEIGKAKDRVRYCMNSFVIAVGTAVKPLLAKAKATAKRLGKVEVDVGDNACKVPVALEAIAKVEAMGRVGKKRASMKC
jgi:3-methyladenine DNA glycosylase AlkD